MYAKIYAQIFDSSLAEDYQTRHVFMDLLVLADRTGLVDMTHDAIARRTNVPVEIVREAICKLCKHDVNSRSSEHGGARLLQLDDHRDWGWQIVNFEHYHKLRDENARRAYMRSYMKKRREKKDNVNSPVNTGKPQLAHVDVDVDVEKERETKELTLSLRVESALNNIGITVPDTERPTFEAWMSAVGKQFIIEQCQRLFGQVLSFFPFKTEVERAKAAQANKPTAATVMVTPPTLEELKQKCLVQYGEDQRTWPRDIQESIREQNAKSA